MREVYLPHFKKASDAGVSCFMASYNRVNGDYAGYSAALVRNILKGEWGYTGWVVSDWFAKGNTLSSPVAGLDIEMPFSSGPFPEMFRSAYFYGTLLRDAVSGGRVSQELVDEAVLRLLYRKVAYGVIAHPVPPTSNPPAPNLTKSDELQELALEAARQGMVLLKNGPARTLADDVLPLSRASVNKIAVVGRFANQENMGDKGSSDAKVVDGTLVVTPAEGIKAALAATNSSWTSCGTAAKCVVSFQNVAGNEANIQSADVAVVVGAYFYADLNRSSSGEEGEWKDRVSMQLPAMDVANIDAVVALKAANPNLKIVVVMKSGGAVVVKPWVDSVDALVMAWFGGMKEGTALGELLFGDRNWSGKTVQSFPVAEADLPPFENATENDVQYDYYHGYRWLERQGRAALYPFGFGLSYTTFEYSNLRLADASVPADGTLQITVDVTNTGPVAGSEVVQAYVGYDDTALTTGWGRPRKELKGFARAEGIAPGETRAVTLTVKASELGYWDVAARAFRVERMTHRLYVGPSSDQADANMRTTTFVVE
jgi:beta-glucosidase